MKKSIIITLGILLLASPAFAHRLNEYLEATTISLSQGKVSLELRLTPGVAVAKDVLNNIDRDHNNQISSAEQQAYLNVLQHDLSFMVDGQKVPLQVISSTFPTAEDMEKGTGDIIIEFNAAVSEKITVHELQFKNAHCNAIAVYLVNCLLPADSAIHVTGQTRSADQSIYTLNFTTGSLKSGAIPISLEQTDRWAVVKTYTIHGIKHILTGYDHLLFLCALVLGAANLWNLIKVVTAFTIAHSITLTLATYGLAHLPETIVEPTIAASIVFVAAQNVFWPRQTKGNSRLAVAFFFGLFHGLGFAGGLLQLMHAMPQNVIVYAILGFSLGVEAGNQLVLLPLYGIFKMAGLFQNGATNPSKRLLNVQRLASVAIAVAGIYYLVIALVNK